MVMQTGCESVDSKLSDHESDVEGSLNGDYTEDLGQGLNSVSRDPFVLARRYHMQTRGIDIAKGAQQQMMNNQGYGIPAELLNYDIPGIRIPVTMRKDATTIPNYAADRVALLAKESPFAPDELSSTVVDHLMKTKWGGEVFVTASKEAVEMLKLEEKRQKLKRKEERKRKRTQKAEKAKGKGKMKAKGHQKEDANQKDADVVVVKDLNHGVTDSGTNSMPESVAISPSDSEPLIAADVDLSLFASSGTTSPNHLRPPPPTPPEYASLPHSLSTPHLPTFHPYPNPLLFAQHQAARAINPEGFDAQTAVIKKALLDAKIERGGSSVLHKAEYSVDLASRKDAKKVAEMGRKRTVQDQDQDEDVNVNEKDSDDSNSNASNTPQPNLKEKRQARTKKGGPSTDQKSAVAPFDLSEHVTKYTTSGTMRQQHSRFTQQNSSGTRTTLTTWIEITQEIFCPSAETLTWDDVRTAVEMKREKMEKEKEEQKEKERGKEKEKMMKKKGKGKEEEKKGKGKGKKGDKSVHHDDSTSSSSSSSSSSGTSSSSSSASSSSTSSGPSSSSSDSGDHSADSDDHSDDHSTDNDEDENENENDKLKNPSGLPKLEPASLMRSISTLIATDTPMAEYAAKIADKIDSTGSPPEEDYGNDEDEYDNVDP